MKKTIVLPREIESFPSKIVLMNSALEKVMYDLGLLTLHLEGILSFVDSVEVDFLPGKTAWISCQLKSIVSTLQTSLLFQLVY